MHGLVLIYKFRLYKTFSIFDPDCSPMHNIYSLKETQIALLPVPFIFYSPGIVATFDGAG